MLSILFYFPAISTPSTSSKCQKLFRFCWLKSKSISSSTTWAKRHRTEAWWRHQGDSLRPLDRPANRNPASGTFRVSGKTLLRFLKAELTPVIGPIRRKESESFWCFNRERFCRYCKLFNFTFWLFYYFKNYPSTDCYWLQRSSWFLDTIYWKNSSTTYIFYHFNI